MRTEAVSIFLYHHNLHRKQLQPQFWTIPLFNLTSLPPSSPLTLFSSSPHLSLCSDMVALVAGSASESTIETLTMDGWKVHRVEAITNPGLWSQSNLHGKKFPARFWAVYTKLLIWSLTEYGRVVYLDADTIALENLDNLFLCDGFCGVLRQAERLNTGVLVITPNKDVLSDMLNKISELPSYTGGDQGFLNAYYDEFSGSPMFYPSQGLLLSQAHPGWRSQKHTEVDRAAAAAGGGGLRMGRIPTGYNADLGLFITNSNRWHIPEDQIHILHYTLAAFKPWDWYSSWIIGPSGGKWQLLRNRLPPSSQGYEYGQTKGQNIAWSCGILILPIVVVVVGVYRRRQEAEMGGGLVTQLIMSLINKGGNSNTSSLHGLVPVLPSGFKLISILAGLGSLCAALFISCSIIIPPQIAPLKGWFLVYEWSAVLFVVGFGQFLNVCFKWGHRWAYSNNGSNNNSGGGGMSGAPIGQTAVLMSCALISVGPTPWAADLLQVPSFVSRILTTAVAVALALVICTQCFISLATVWFMFGARRAAPLPGAAAKYAVV